MKNYLFILIILICNLPIYAEVVIDGSFGLETTLSGNNENVEAKHADKIGVIQTNNSSPIGNAGDITIVTNFLDINPGVIASITASDGNAGNIIINANNEISLNNGGFCSNRICSSISAATYDDSSGNAGDVILRTNILKSNYGEINTFSRGTGGAGNANITANTVFFSNSNLVSENRDANGGNISMQINQLLFADDSWMMSLTEGKHRGGEININKPQFFVLNTSKINATSNQGADGKIIVDSNYFIQSSDSTLDGEIQITAGKENFSNSLMILPKTFFDASDFLLKSCPKSKEFYKNFFKLQKRKGLSELFKKL